MVQSMEQEVVAAVSDGISGGVIALIGAALTAIGGAFMGLFKWMLNRTVTSMDAKIASIQSKVDEHADAIQDFASGDDLDRTLNQITNHISQQVGNLKDDVRTQIGEIKTDIRTIHARIDTVTLGRGIGGGH